MLGFQVVLHGSPPVRQGRHEPVLVPRPPCAPRPCLWQFCGCLRWLAGTHILFLQRIRWVRATLHFEPGQGRETAAIRSLCRVPVPIERTLFL